MPTKKILLIILGIFLVVILAFGAYSLGKNQKDSETSSGTVDNSSKTQQPTETSSCVVDLTTEESETISSWKTYTNSADGYSFKHPADWEVIAQGDTSVILTNDAALFSFQFGTLDADQGSGYSVESREGVEVACENTQKQSLTGQPPGGENFRRVLTLFTKDGTNYTALLTFRFVDEPTSKKLKETYDLILKTIEFN